VGSAVRRRCPRGPAPPPEGHMPQPTPARKGAPVGTPACGLALRGLVGAIGWSYASPRYAEDAATAGRFYSVPSCLTNSRPLGGVGLSGCSGFVLDARARPASLLSG
jgi:hypothetical protein